MVVLDSLAFNNFNIKDVLELNLASKAYLDCINSSKAASELDLAC